MRPLRGDFYKGAGPLVRVGEAGLWAEPARREAYLKQYVDRPSGEPARRQVRRHRACEVKRPLYVPGAKKKNRNESGFRIGGCSRSLRERCGLDTLG